jgi:hypothetical protein
VLECRLNIPDILIGPLHSLFAWDKFFLVTTGTTSII